MNGVMWYNSGSSIQHNYLEIHHVSSADPILLLSGSGNTWYEETYLGWPQPAMVWSGFWVPSQRLEPGYYLVLSLPQSSLILWLGTQARLQAIAG